MCTWSHSFVITYCIYGAPPMGAHKSLREREREILYVLSNCSVASLDASHLGGNTSAQQRLQRIQSG